MSTRLAALALSLVVAGGAAGCKEPTGPERPISGERLFAQNCARCHGSDGRGAAEAPAGTRDLTAAGYMSTLTDERIKATIRMGKPPNMPAFGDRFAEPSLKVLVAYVRHLAAAPTGAEALPAPAGAPSPVPPGDVAPPPSASGSPAAGVAPAEGAPAGAAAPTDAPAPTGAAAPTDTPAPAGAPAAPAPE